MYISYVPMFTYACTYPFLDIFPSPSDYNHRTCCLSGKLYIILIRLFQSKKISSIIKY